MVLRCVAAVTPMTSMPIVRPHSRNEGGYGRHEALNGLRINKKMTNVERSLKQDGAYMKAIFQEGLEALCTPERQWTKQQKTAVKCLWPLLSDMARLTLRRFHMHADKEACDEVVQIWVELFLRDRLVSLDRRYGFQQYARNFMKRAAGRKADRRKLRRHMRCLKHADGVRARGPNPSQRFEELQTIEEVRAELQKFSDTLWKTAKCVIFDGMTTKETADALDLPEGTVRSHKCRITEQLKKRYS